MTIEQRIDNGIQRLDSYFGPGWEDRIDTTELRIESCARCVLGQLFADYYDGLDEFKFTQEDSWAHAFSGFDHNAGSESYKVLNEPWRDAIKSLRANRVRQAEREMVSA